MCQCSNNPCGCGNQIELPYLKGNNGTNGTNGINGTNAPTITTITSSVSGNNLTLTFNFSNETSLSTTVNIASTYKSYILESFIGDPLTQITTGANGLLTGSVLNIPANTLSQDGDIFEFEYAIESSIIGLNDYEFQLQFNASTNIVTGQNLKFTSTGLIIKGEITRVTATKVHISFYTKNFKGVDLFDDGHYAFNRIVTVSNLTSNALSLNLNIVSFPTTTPASTLSLLKSRSIITKK